VQLEKKSNILGGTTLCNWAHRGKNGSVLELVFVEQMVVTVVRGRGGGGYKKY
jgi:hypothetical protein